jgi:hypothetical protein
MRACPPDVVGDQTNSQVLEAMHYQASRMHAYFKSR